MVSNHTCKICQKPLTLSIDKVNYLCMENECLGIGLSYRKKQLHVDANKHNLSFELTDDNTKDSFSLEDVDTHCRNMNKILNKWKMFTEKKDTKYLKEASLPMSCIYNKPRCLQVVGDCSFEYYIIAMLLNCNSLRLRFNHQCGDYCDIFYNLCTKYDQALKVDSDELCEKLMQETLKQAKTFLLKDNSCTPPNKDFETTWRLFASNCSIISDCFTSTFHWTARCLDCNIDVKENSTTNAGPFVFKGLAKAFHPFFNAATRVKCHECNTIRKLKRSINFEKMSPCFVIYFEVGLPHNTNVQQLGFNVGQYRYEVYAIMMDIGRLQHAVWIHDHKSDRWLSLDDNLDKTEWHSKLPKQFNYKKIRAVIWEKKCFDLTLRSLEEISRQNLDEFFKPCDPSSPLGVEKENSMEIKKEIVSPPPLVKKPIGRPRIHPPKGASTSSVNGSATKRQRRIPRATTTFLPPYSPSCKSKNDDASKETPTVRRRSTRSKIFQGSMNENELFSSIDESVGQHDIVNIKSKRPAPKVEEASPPERTVFPKADSDLARFRQQYGTSFMSYDLHEVDEDKVQEEVKRRAAMPLVSRPYNKKTNLRLLNALYNQSNPTQKRPDEVSTPAGSSRQISSPDPAPSKTVKNRNKFKLGTVIKSSDYDGSKFSPYRFDTHET